MKILRASVLLLLIYLASAPVYAQWSAEDSLSEVHLYQKPHLAPLWGTGVFGFVSISRYSSFPFSDFYNQYRDIEVQYTQQNLYLPGFGITNSIKLYKNFHYYTDVMFIQKGGEYEVTKRYGTQVEKTQMKNVLNYLSFDIFLQGRFGQKRLQFLILAGIFFSTFIDGNSTRTHWVSNAYYTERSTKNISLKSHEHGVNPYDSGLLYGIGFLYKFNRFSLLLDAKLNFGANRVYGTRNYIDDRINNNYRLNLSCVFPLLWQ